MKLTLHKVLSELKVIDKKISSSIYEFDLFKVKKGDKLIKSHLSEDEFKTNATASLQSVEDLIARKFKLKSALFKANNEIKVTIAGREYTIVEAIEMKSLIESLMTEELKALKQLHRSAISTYESESAKLDTDFERLLTIQLSGVEKASDRDALRSNYEKLFYDSNKLTLLDPTNSINRIKELEDFIESFKLDVDAALSEANSINYVEIDD